MATPKKRKTHKPINIEAALAKGKSFGEGENGEFEGATYQSRIDDNAWTPRQHPAVWVLISTE